MTRSAATALLALVATIAGLLWGCSGDDGDQNTDPGDTSSANTSTSTSFPVVTPADLELITAIELDGSWVRPESNNDPNDGMLIDVVGNRAVLTSVPETSSGAWEAGEVLWRNIESDGTLQVLGSDNQYYDARMTFEGADRLHVDIAANGAGNDQTWERVPTCWPDEYMAAHGSHMSNIWTRANRLPDGARDALVAARDAGAEIQTVALTPDGEWVIVAADRPCYSPDFPEGTRSAIDGFIAQGRSIDVVAFGPNDRWIVVADDLLRRNGVSDDVAARVRKLQEGGKRVDAVALGPDGTVVVGGGRAYAIGFETPPSDLSDAIEAAEAGRRAIHDVVHSADSWVLVAEDWYASSGVSTELWLELDRYRTSEERRIDHVVLHPDGDRDAWAIISNEVEPAPDATDLINLVEHGLPGDRSIYQRMALYGVQALAIAAIDDNRIAWARGYGSRAASTTSPSGALEVDLEQYVYPSTIFDAASVSKPVAAVGALQLVDAGTLDLTGEVLTSLIGPVLSPIAAGAFLATLNPLGDITLSRLLSHCAGLDHLNGGPGADPRDADRSEIPIGKVIMGASPANPGHLVRRTSTPGDAFHYSGANYAIVQGLIEANAAEGFNVHMRTLFDDLGMVDSSFRPPVELDRYARGFDSAVCGGTCPVQQYPNKAAAGLTSTVLDLANFVIMLNRNGRFEDRTILGGATVRRMMRQDGSAGSTLVEEQCAQPDNMGLGVRVRTDPSDQRFRHGGLHNGYRTGIYGYRTKRAGLVVLMTGDRAANRTDALGGEIRASFESQYVDE